MYYNTEELMLIVKDNIEKFMYTNRLTIAKMAEKCDLSDETICTLLYRKPKDCKLATLVKLSNAMNITIDDLIKKNT